jgi:hypothetical protein
VPKYRASDESGIFPGGPRPLQDESISDGTAAETVKILQAAILTDSKLHPMQQAQMCMNNSLA